MFFIPYNDIAFFSANTEILNTFPKEITTNT